MKIGSFIPSAGKIDAVKHFRPAQSLLVVFKSDSVIGVLDFKSNTTKINVNLQNSKTGSLSALIPYISVTRLSEISTFNEGSVLVETQSYISPVMLHPTENISLDNDKYLEFSFIDIPGWVSSVDLYTYEMGTTTDFVTKYNKMSCPAGSARVVFNTVDNDLLALPLTGFDSVRLTYKNGLVADMSAVELKYYMAQNNDLSAYQSSADGINVKGFLVERSFASFAELNTALSSGSVLIQGTAQTYQSLCSSFIFNLVDVVSIEIIRDTNSVNSLEFILGDFVPSTVAAQTK
ncbi:MAG: hypothetical protein QM751_06165 [Paludibacteraceae bacterium]